MILIAMVVVLGISIVAFTSFYQVHRQQRDALNDFHKRTDDILKK